MDRDEFMAVLTPMLLGLNVEFDQPTWTVYFQKLRDIPQVLLAAAVDRALAAPRDDKYEPVRPAVPTLRRYAEQARLAIRAAEPYGCEACQDARGWQIVTVDGVQHVERCPCVAERARRLEALGAGDRSLLVRELPADIKAEWLDGRMLAAGER